MIYLVLSFILVSFSYPIHSFNQPFITASKKANPSVVSIVSEKIIEQDNPMHKPKTNLFTIILAPVNFIAVPNERTKRFWYDQFEITYGMR